MLLRQITQRVTSYAAAGLDTPTAIVLYKATWTATQLLDPSNDWAISTSAELARCLFGLFTLVHDVEHEEDGALNLHAFPSPLICVVKGLMLQGLTCVDGASLKAALTSVQEDSRINFVMKTDLGKRSSHIAVAN